MNVTLLVIVRVVISKGTAVKNERWNTSLRGIPKPNWGMPGLEALKEDRGATGDGCSYVSLQLIFRNGPIEGLIAGSLRGIGIVRPAQEVEQILYMDQAQRSAVERAC